MTKSNLRSDPVALFTSLTPDEIESRLRELAAEENALRVLLRSLRARERTRKRLATAEDRQEESRDA
jgi:hypothetical protein